MLTQRLHRSEAVHICHAAAQSLRIRGKVRQVELSSATDISDTASLIVLVLCNPLPGVHRFGQDDLYQAVQFSAELLGNRQLRPHNVRGCESLEARQHSNRGSPFHPPGTEENVI